jgi:hypothetical protein
LLLGDQYAMLQIPRSKPKRTKPELPRFLSNKRLCPAPRTSTKTAPAALERELLPVRLLLLAPKSGHMHRV